MERWWQMGRSRGAAARGSYATQLGFGASGGALLDGDEPRCPYPGTHGEHRAMGRAGKARGRVTSAGALFRCGGGAWGVRVRSLGFRCGVGSLGLRGL